MVAKLPFVFSIITILACMIATCTIKLYFKRNNMATSLVHGMPVFSSKKLLTQYTLRLC